MRRFLFYPLFIIITYLFYVYPFRTLNSMITDDEILNFNSFVVSLFFSALIIYNSKSKNTFLFSKLLIYEGLGIGFISFWVVNLGLFINIFNFIESYNLGIVCILFILILTLLSFYNGSKINIKKLNVYSSKLKKPLKLIFLSDIHLGTNTIEHLEKIYKKIIKLEFDFILVGGDLIDSSSFELKDLKILKNLKKPIYFISGNHEYYIKNYQEKLGKLNEYNINFLDNKSIKYKNINIIGVSDNQSTLNQTETVNKFYKPNLFNLVVVHKPTLWEFINKQIDLTLSGHTHNGQIVPFNFLVKLRFKNIYGLYEKFQSKLYVSCGVGCWGPRMRLGSTNEIVLLSISNQA